MNVDEVVMDELLDKIETWMCPNCKEASPKKEWKGTYVGCEDCGEHPAVTCPKCDDTFDLIFRENDIRDVTISFLEKQGK